MKRDSLSYLPAEIGLPPPLAQAIEKARVFVAERGGGVTLTVDTQGPFCTWWTLRSWGRRSEEIETTPVLRMQLGEYCIQEALIFRGTNRGDCWMGVGHVESMVRFVVEHEPLPRADARAPSEFDDVHAPNNASNEQLDLEEVLAVRFECDAEAGVRRYLDLKNMYPRSFILVQFADAEQQHSLRHGREDQRVEPYGEALWTRSGPQREGEPDYPPYEVMLAVEHPASLAERAAAISGAPHREYAPLPVRFMTWPIPTRPS